MWAFGRASVHLRNRDFSLGTTRFCRVQPEIANCRLETYCGESIESQGEELDVLVCSRRFYSKSLASLKSRLRICSFSSQAGADRIRDQDDTVENAAPELEFLNNVANEAISGDEMDDGMSFESEKTSKTEVMSSMAKALLAAQSVPMSLVLDSWVESGNEVKWTEVSCAMIHLRKRRMFFVALQLSEWLESRLKKAAQVERE